MGKRGEKGIIGGKSAMVDKIPYRAGRFENTGLMKLDNFVHVFHLYSRPIYTGT